MDRSEDNLPNFDFIDIKCGGKEHTYLLYDTLKDVLSVNTFDEKPIRHVKNPIIEQILHLMSNAPECKEKYPRGQMNRKSVNPADTNWHDNKN